MDFVKPQTLHKVDFVMDLVEAESFVENNACSGRTPHKFDFLGCIVSPATLVHLPAAAFEGLSTLEL